MFTDLLVDTAPDDNSQSKDNHILNRVRQLIHQRLIDSIETDGLEVLSNQSNIKAQIRWLITELEQKRGLEFNSWEKRQLESEILVELDGLGPLASLMLDNTVSDILVNGPKDIWVDRQGFLEKTDIGFDDEQHVRRFLDRLLANQGKALDSSKPMIDAKLADGSRVHAVIPPLSSTGAIISIRRFQQHDESIENLIAQGFMSDGMLAVLSLAVESGMNIVISGGASAGKTSLINQLSSYIPDNERVVTIEESNELKLKNAHSVALEGRNANMEGCGAIGLRELLRTALRMRADRIIVGEVRGAEVFDMLQAMNVGHDGSMTTVHANSPADVIPRLEMLALSGDNNLTRSFIKDMIGSAIQLVVHLTRYPNGKRCISAICTVSNKDGDIKVEEILTDEHSAKYEQTNAELLPRQLEFLQRIRQRGIDTGCARKLLEQAA